MSERFTKSTARNIYLGGGVFSFLLFLGLTVDTMERLPERDNRENITAEVALGKKIWEDNNCIGCHTLLGEGAYFAPELGNVYTRFGNDKQMIKDVISSRPVEGVEGRRSMPQFNLSEEELEAMSEFLKWTSEIDTNDWPPNVEG